MPKPSRNRHRQNQVLLQQPEIEPGQHVARVVQASGENNYLVETREGATKLYHLPKRLRYVTFVKRGSFVFVRDDDTRKLGKVCGDIEVVVLDVFLSSLRKEPFWPTHFLPTETTASPMDAVASPGLQPHKKASAPLDVDEEVDNENWEFGMGNPNKGKWDHIQDDDDDEDDSEEEGGVQYSVNGIAH